MRVYCMSYFLHTSNTIMLGNSLYMDLILIASICCTIWYYNENQHIKYKNFILQTRVENLLHERDSAFNTLHTLDKELNRLNKDYNKLCLNHSETSASRSNNITDRLLEAMLSESNDDNDDNDDNDVFEMDMATTASEERSTQTETNLNNEFSKFVI